MNESDNYELRAEGAEQTIPAWFGNEIARGLQHLRQLCLPHAPRDTPFIESVALWASDCWWSVRQLGISHDTDEQAIQEAFRLLRVMSKRWPTPNQFLTQLQHVIDIRSRTAPGGIQ